jgi:hypothetical protein
VPRYLTRPTAEQPGSWQGQGSVPAPATSPATTGAGRPVPRWAQPSPTRPQSNTDLAGDRNVHPWRLGRVAREFERWAALTTQPPRLRQGLNLSADGAWRVPGVPDGSDLARLIAHHASEMMLRSRLGPLLEHRYQIPGTGITLGLDIRRVETHADKDGRPLAFEQKARRYQQNESGPINKGDSSSGWELSFGPQGGAPAGSIKKLGWHGDGLGGERKDGEGHAAEMSEVNERNIEAKRTFHQYRYDVTAVIHGPHGTLLVDVDRGLYLMREQAPTVPTPTTPLTTELSDPAHKGTGGKQSTDGEESKQSEESKQAEQGKQAEQSAVDGTAQHPRWTVEPDGAHQWHGAGAPPSLPPNLQLGQASGVDNRCLIDSLGQLIRAHSDNTMDTDGLTEFLKANLPRDSAVYQDLVAGRMIDAYDPALANLLIDNFGLRLQVFEVAETPPRVIPHPVRGDEGPILYLRHQGLHFTPLWPVHPS